MDAQRIAQEHTRIADAHRKVHRETIRNHPELEERIQTFLKTIDWEYVSELGRMHQSGSHMSGNAFVVSEKNILFNYDDTSKGVMQYDLETRMTIINLASPIVRAVINRPDKTPPSQQDLFMIFHAMMHEIGHAQGFAVAQYTDPHLERSSPNLFSGSLGRQVRTGYGGRDSFEMRMRDGSVRAISKDFGLFWFEGMTELLAMVNTRTYLERRGISYAGATISAEGLEEFNKKYLMSQGTGYSGPLRVLGITINTIAKVTGVARDKIVQSFIRGYCSPHGFRDLSAALQELAIPPELIEKSIHVGVHNPASRKVEHELIQRIEKILHDRPQIAVAFTSGTYIINPQAWPPRMPTEPDKK